MTAARPLVSVLMASHNAETFIAESIESVLAQTYPAVELVVADDASTDGTAGIVAAYERRHPGRVRLLRHTVRAGPCRRRNDALAAARGSLLAWLDHDDLWLPDKTEREVRVLESDPRVGLVYTGYEAFDPDSGEVLTWRDSSSEAEGDVLAPLFVEGCFIASLTALFRREAMSRRGLTFRERDFSFGDDYFLWLAIALDWRVVRIDDVLARYRRHAGNESARLSATNFHLLRIRLLREFLAEFPEAQQRLERHVRRGLAAHYARAAGFELERGSRRGWARYAAAALVHDPRGALSMLL